MNLSLPAINAMLNGCATMLLIAGGIAIWSGRREVHRKLMLAAFGVSTIFLISYVTHRIQVQGMHTPFLGTGGWRTFYYIMLASHVILAMAIVPMIIQSIRFGLKGNWTRHKRWAKVTYPLWLYVSVTGVLVYFFLYRWFV